MAIRNPATATPSEAQPTSDAAKKYAFVQQSMTHPKFLHSNSTSHIWAFGAIAELVDNATDPDVMATRFWIDVEEEKNGQPRLCFTDNGYGMEIDKLYKMLSFGYCEKEEVNGHKPIGHYGNGFKSGSMRLGRDALVFTRSKSTFSIGMLSQTFLFAENATSVLVPMVTWDATGKCLTELQAAEQCLGAIQTYSPFKTIHEIMNRFKKIPNSTKGGTGTHIVVYNLRTVGKERDAPYELDFETDPRDIRIANVLTPEGKKLHFQQHRNGQGTQVEIPIDFSLREYCSILYSKPRMIINLRGTKVRTKFVEASLGYRMFDVYKNTRITFGMNVDNPNLYGIMLYHRNRLIKPYLRVGIQNQINPDAVGVIGIIEADFLQPTHNKQDFDVNTSAYKNCIQTLATKLEAYWKSYKNKSINPSGNSNFSTNETPDTWAQCEDCNKWRRLPPNIKEDMLPEHWYCRDNIYDSRRNTCDAPEENQVEVVIQHSGDLKQVRLEERRREKEAKKREEEQKRIEAERRKAEEELKQRQIEEQKRILKQREEELQRKNKEIEEIKRAREAKKKEKEAKRRAALEEERRLAAQAEAVKRLNSEVRGPTNTSAPSARSSTSESAAAVHNVELSLIEQDDIKQEPSPMVSLNTTAAQLRRSSGATEDLDNKKRKREDESFGQVNSATDAQPNKAPRTEATHSPRQAATSASGANSSISPSSATNPLPMHSSPPTQTINRDESLIANFFGDTQSSIPNNEMRMDEDLDIDLNDASIDLMAESSSQSQHAHVDSTRPIANGVDHVADNALVSGLMNNIHKLLKAYSVIVPEQAEQLQNHNMSDPAKLATLDLDPLIMALTKKRSSEQMAAKTAERELISMQRKVREVLNVAHPDKVADVPDSELYPHFCDFVASYKKHK